MHPMPFRSFDKAGSSEWSQKIQDIFDEMLHREFFDFREGGEWRPAVNEYESADALYICVEIAGIDTSGCTVDCRGERLVIISGRRESPRPECATGPLSIHALEIDEGCFRREIELPVPVDMQGLSATQDKGYLWLRLPKKARP
jgi:HSP20 family molecular chaperone IbpA